MSEKLTRNEWRMRDLPKLFLQAFLPLHWICRQSNDKPIKAIVSAERGTERSNMIRAWKEATLYQLQIIAVIGAILSIVIVRAFPWSTLTQISPASLGFVRLAWFSSLIASVSAVAIALRQSAFMTKLSNVPEFEDMLTEVLRYKAPSDRWEVRIEQAFTWLPAMGLLEWGLDLWLGGYVIYMWDFTKTTQEDNNSHDFVIAATCAVVVFVSLKLYLFRVCTAPWKAWKAEEHLNIDRKVIPN